MLTSRFSTKLEYLFYGTSLLDYLKIATFPNEKEIRYSVVLVSFQLSHKTLFAVHVGQMKLEDFFRQDYELGKWIPET